MAAFDTIITGGRLVTAVDTMDCDLAIKEGRIAALGQDLGSAERLINATGKLVLPGGVEGHCHIEQKSSFGIENADDFFTATRSAVCGGTTTVIPFAAQHRGQSLRAAVEEYHGLAGPKAVIDYGYHLIISDPTPQVLGQELPALIEDGFTSFKVYMTYDLLQLQDYQMLEVLAVARRHGALVMVHAENYDMIRWLSDQLLEGGHWQPQYHAVSHSRAGEGEATHRAITMAKLVDVPMLVVHVSAEEAMTEIRKAQDAGLKIYGETCPQYLFLTAEDLDRDGMEGAKFCCSPPPRDEAAQEAIWRGLANGHLPGLLLRSRPLPLRRERQAQSRAPAQFQADRQRRPRHRAALAPLVLRRRRQGAYRHPSVRGPDRHQRGQALRLAPQEGQHRRGRRRRSRHLGTRRRR